MITAASGDGCGSESGQCLSEPKFRFCRRPISSFLAVAFYVKEMSHDT
jgi:hypothetical protein